MSSNLSYKTDNNKFKCRAGGVLIKNNKLLVVGTDKNNSYALPGGNVEFGESSEETVIREITEETGYKVAIEEYLGVIENFFENDKHGTVHELSFYYLIDPSIDIIEEDFTGTEDESYSSLKLNYKWVELDKLDTIDLRPEVLKESLKNGNLTFNHLVIYYNQETCI